MSLEPEICMRCDETIPERDVALGWPVCVDAEDSDPDDDVHEYVCPACYGDEAFCRLCGEVLAAEEGARCPDCDEEDSR